MKRTFAIVTIDTVRQANLLNERYKERDSDIFKMRAVPIGHHMCGVRWGADRPNMWIDLTTDKNHKLYEDWYAMMRGVFSNDAIITNEYRRVNH
ncbi:hypothetical protein [Bacillus mycoides]|uniref:hypothetical protein n=1 Tax=Bacillus mycoides TaxID=1405 RepID=UPI00059575AC|nr:hypothetical protein [Bacillus mycoides]